LFIEQRVVFVAVGRVGKRLEGVFDDLIFFGIEGNDDKTAFRIEEANRFAKAEP
jgi:hypothetical protein